MKSIRKIWLKFSILTIIVLTIFSSCQKDDNSPEAGKTDVSRWIYSWMKEVYYWVDKLPVNVNIQEKTDPIAFFDELIYKSEDRWSYITDDYSALELELSGTPVSMGYSPAFGLFSGSDKVFIVVEYVYPNSPASYAGLKRGDIILTINGESLDTMNYYYLFSQPDYTAELGTVSGNQIYNSHKSITMKAASIDADPLIYSNIYNIADRKIGYIVYTEFISGENNKYLDVFDAVIDNFISNQITDLVVDLRYNPGGQIDAAGHLASAIAPAGVVSSSETFVKFVYNSSLQSYYYENDGSDSDHLTYKFPSNTHNVNLSHVYFLTTKNTASASELLITGLKPYMDVTVIGENTFGKYVGSWVIYDDRVPPKHNYAIMPIVMKYSNSQGYTDFKDGLAPDLEMKDNLIEAPPFGDPEDPMLAAAIQDITGMALKSAKTLEYPAIKRLDSRLDRIRRNLIIPMKDYNPGN